MDIDSGYGIGFNARSQLEWSDGSWGKYVIMFCADMSSSVQVDIKNKNILVLGECLTQRLDDTTLKAEAKYALNFTQLRKTFVLSMHCNGDSSFWYVNAVKMYQFKAKDSEIKSYLLCVGNILKDFTVHNMKKTGLQ